MFDYPVKIAAQPEGGFVATFPDVREAITQGDDCDEALLYAVEAPKQRSRSMSMTAGHCRCRARPSAARPWFGPACWRLPSWRSTPKCLRKAGDFKPQAQQPRVNGSRARVDESWRAIVRMRPRVYRRRGRGAPCATIAVRPRSQSRCGRGTRKPRKQLGGSRPASRRSTGMRAF